MSQDYVRHCPTCGQDNAPEVMRCPCGALLVGVDLSRREAPSSPAPMAAIELPPAAAAQRCPFDDCGQDNPPDAPLCLYCNRPLRATLTPPAEPLLQLPATLRQRYRLKEALPASGAEAELLLVEPLAGGVPCIAKIYRHGIAPKAEVTARLQTIPIAHRVNILEAGQADGYAYEVMEYCPLGSLRPWMAAGALPAPRLLEIIAELAGALAAVHAARLIHRDLKPENILVRRADPLDLVLTDFGIASVQDATLRFTGNARTLAYGAPESIAGILDGKADYWSLGIIALEAALGRHPFNGLSEAVILHRLATRPVDLGGVNDLRLKRLLRGLLQRDPKVRWGGEEVRRWLAADSTLPEPPEDHSTLTDRQPYRIGNEECFTPEQLAIALARHWTLATADLDNGQLMTWFRQELRDHNLVRFLIDLNFEQKGHADERLLRLLLYLAPGLPPVWRGESLALGQLLARAGQALKGNREAADWLEILHRRRVVAAYAAAGNPEMADIAQRWQAALDRFNVCWQSCEARLPELRPNDGIVLFDDVVFGRGSGQFKRPPPGLLHARLLALIFDERWAARLRHHLKIEVTRLATETPWLTDLADPAHCPGPDLLVLHGLLPEAERSVRQAANQREASRQEEEEEARQLAESSVTVLFTLQQRANASLFSAYVRDELRQALEDFFRLLRQARASTSLPAKNPAVLGRLVRAEPLAIRIQDLLDQLEARAIANQGWLDRRVLGFAGAAIFLLPIVLGNRWFVPLLLTATAIALWRSLPNLTRGRQIRRLARKIEA